MSVANIPSFSKHRCNIFIFRSVYYSYEKRANAVRTLTKWNTIVKMLSNTH